MSSLIISLILISVLVVVHEFGHFIVAKKCGVRVEEFAVGMGRKLFSVTKGETEYSVRLLPLGGFCRMEGESDDGEASETSFLSKSVPARFAIMFAGPFMNFVLALIMILGLNITTQYIAAPEIGTVIDNTPAQTIGLQEGDVFHRINGKRIHIYDELLGIMSTNTGETVEIEVLRNGEKMQYTVTPALNEAGTGYIFGFTAKLYTGLLAEEKVGYSAFSLTDSLEYSYYAMINYVKLTAEGLARVFTFTASSDEYGGPIAIVQMVGDSYESGMTYGMKAAIQNVVYIGAVLSANLGVLNLFPIPALDGGRILFLLLEAIRRKPLKPELENKIQFAGFAFLMGLMLYIMYGDIVKIFL